MIGINSLTGTVHNAKHDGTGLVQTCGIKANQKVYLSELTVEMPVTCKKCQGQTPRTSPKVERVSKTYGRQEWTITDLREVAKELNIKGRTSKTGEELLEEIIKLAPQFA